MTILWETLGSAIYNQFLMAGFEERSYQTSSALSLADSIASGRNAILQLPPGVGKTLVAQLAMALNQQRLNNKKQLMVVPTTLLVDQHLHAASWLKPHLTVSKVSPEQAQHPSAIRYLARSADVLVSTPKLLWNALSGDILPFEYLDEVCVCFVDEYDEFVKHDEDSLRIHADFDALFKALSRRGTLFVGLSAAMPMSDARAAYWRAQLRADLCAPTGADVGPYLPALNVHFCSSLDPRVTDEDGRITDTISKALKEAEKQLSEQARADVELDLSKLLPILASIVAGKKRVVRFSGLNLVITSAVRDQFAKIQGQLHERLKLFEDASGVVDVGTSVKAEALTCLIQKRGSDLGLVMMRYIDPGEAIRQRLVSCGVECRMVHGQLDPETRSSYLDSLIGDEEGVLVLTRNLGGRGFDFPQANYAIFYSPKEDESVMWQEMLRIRSCRRNVKDVYVLYYTGTTERDKAQALYEQIVQLWSKGYRLVNRPL